LKDQSLRYIDVNPAFEALAGLPASEIIGKRHEDIFGNEGTEIVRDADLRVLEGKTIEGELSKTIRGVRRTYLATRIPLCGASDEIVGIITLLQDVTDRKSIEVPPAMAEEYPSKAMRSTLNQVRIAAKSNSTILLTGESGSGKDYLAQYIHKHSDRAGGPFFSVNCAAISPQLAESELFGHEKGSFTGAVARKRGILELAEGGTLLLNEIGELSLPLQAKLLTFMDTKKFPRVGGEKEISVNARLIAATNRDLKQEVDAGRFRQDLFYRINVMSISVPPLRERMEDIPLLVQEILTKLREVLQIHELPIVNREVIAALNGYDWPGNVRELRNVLERALILSRGKYLELDGLKVRKGEAPLSEGEEAALSVSFPNQRSLNEITKDVKRFLIDGALRKSNGSRQGAARLLGISRYSLKHYMKTLGYSDEG
jgi:two-component system response regulator AtoC